MFNLLFTDDDSKISETVKTYFTANGFEVTLASDGRQAVELCESHEYDLIVLDVMMPKLDGIAACRQIRKNCRTPILFLSALGEETDYLKGFGVGADDYIVKPFPLSVLVEKCLALIRRATGSDKDDLIKVGDITLDCRRKKVFAREKEIALSAKDFEMLQYLMKKKGVVLSRSLILSRVWGYDFEGEDRVIDTHIKNIRKALGDCAGAIRTVSGMGYVFEEEERK